MHRVAIIGCGRMGQQYTDAYMTFPDTKVVAIAEQNPQPLLQGCGFHMRRSRCEGHFLRQTYCRRPVGRRRHGRDLRLQGHRISGR